MPHHQLNIINNVHWCNAILCFTAWILKLTEQNNFVYSTVCHKQARGKDQALYSCLLLSMTISFFVKLQLTFRSWSVVDRMCVGVGWKRHDQGRQGSVCHCSRAAPGGAWSWLCQRCQQSNELHCLQARERTNLTQWTTVCYCRLVIFFLWFIALYLSNISFYVILFVIF